MTSIDHLFAELRSRQQTAFIPFVTAGDPDMAFTCRVIAELVRRGSHLCEVGIPYSDPIADGPVIQASYTRALHRGIKLDAILGSLRESTTDLPAPVVTMISYAIVLRVGPESYIERARSAGVTGAIVPDLPLEEAVALSKICEAHEFNLIQLVTPTTGQDRALRIAETSTGFLYYVSVTGITGERTELPDELIDNVGWLRDHVELPVCIGFGINQPSHVRLLAPVADGLIVGSAIVRRIATARDRSRDEVLRDVGEYASEMLAALEEA